MFENKIGKFKCAFCGGTGIQPHFLKSRCLACRGKGEVEFESPVIQCPSCKGKGRLPNALLSCIRCRGVGAVAKEESKDVGDIMTERLGEITERLKWTRKETEKRTEEIEKKIKPIKKELKPLVKEIKKESLWLKKLGNKIKRGWKSVWEQ